MEDSITIFTLIHSMELLAQSLSPLCSLLILLLSIHPLIILLSVHCCTPNIHIPTPFHHNYSDVHPLELILTLSSHHPAQLCLIIRLVLSQVPSFNPI